MSIINLSLLHIDNCYKFHIFFHVLIFRGLLLPKIVVSELGIVRRDAGLLGSGLYFGDRLR